MNYEVLRVADLRKTGVNRFECSFFLLDKWNRERDVEVEIIFKDSREFKTYIRSIDGQRSYAKNLYSEKGQEIDSVIEKHINLKIDIAYEAFGDFLTARKESFKVSQEDLSGETHEYRKDIKVGEFKRSFYYLSQYFTLIHEKEDSLVANVFSMIPTFKRESNFLEILRGDIRKINAIETKIIACNISQHYLGFIDELYLEDLYTSELRELLHKAVLNGYDEVLRENSIVTAGVLKSYNKNAFIKVIDKISEKYSEKYHSEFKKGQFFSFKETEVSRYLTDSVVYRFVFDDHKVENMLQIQEIFCNLKKNKEFPVVTAVPFSVEGFKNCIIHLGFEIEEYFAKKISNLKRDEI